MWSEPAKQGLLRHNPRMMLIDVVRRRPRPSASAARSPAGTAPRPTRPGSSSAPNARVITDDGRDVVPGSGEIGRVAVRGPHAGRLLQGPEKTAATFVTIDGDALLDPRRLRRGRGRRHAHACSGRGSVCINTGGEKVYPEEVEEVLKAAPDGARRGGRRRARRALRRGHHRRGRGRCPARPSTTAELDRLGEEPAGLLQGAEAASCPSTPSAGPPTARSTTSG